MGGYNGSYALTTVNITTTTTAVINYKDITLINVWTILVT